MTYENHENYPPYDSNGKWGMWGYPSAMLEMSIARDDIDGFEFYRTRYFGDKPMIFGSHETLAQYCRRKGGNKIADMLESKC